MADPEKNPGTFNKEKILKAESSHGKDVNEVFRYLDQCALQSRYSSPLVYRSEYDIGLIPDADQDLRKRILSIDQFKSSANRGMTLLTTIEERLHEDTFKSKRPKYGVAWEEVRNTMLDASREIFIANRIFEKLKDNGSSCISYLNSILLEMNEKWFLVRNLIQVSDKKELT